MSFKRGVTLDPVCGGQKARFSNSWGIAYPVAVSQRRLGGLEKDAKTPKYALPKGVQDK